MSLGLLAILLFVAIVLVTVVAAQIFPKASTEVTDAEAEQDITGIGETKFGSGPDDTAMG